MKLYTSERTALLVDGPNFHATMKALDCEPDYRKLQEFFSTRTVLVDCAYYTRVWTEEDDETKEKDFKPLMPLLDYLQYNGWRVVKKDVKEQTNSSGHKYRSGDAAIELACDIVDLSKKVGTIILCSGNGDFRYPVQKAMLNGCRVGILSCKEPQMVSDALRREATGFIEAAGLVSAIRREK